MRQGARSTLSSSECMFNSLLNTGSCIEYYIFRYGGPGSQLVDSRFGRDWHHYLACSLQYIVVVVDGRGTGYKGRELRNPVRGNLGYWEVVDQINAAK